MHEDVGVLPIHFHMNMGTCSNFESGGRGSFVQFDGLWLFGKKKKVNGTPNVKLSLYFNRKKIHCRFWCTVKPKTLRGWPLPVYLGIFS